MDPLKEQLKSDQFKYRTELLCEKLRTGRVTGSLACAKQTAKLVELLVDIGDRVGKYHDVESLVERLKELRAKLQAAGPEQVSITNLILRVLHLIRTEPAAEHDADLPDQPAASPDQPQLLGGVQPSPPLRTFGRVVSLSNIMEQPVVDAARAANRRELSNHPEHDTQSAESSGQLSTLNPKDGKEQDAWPGKDALLSALTELFAELDGVESQVAANSADLVLNNHNILTHGFDDTVLRVLKDARKKRRFTVYVTAQEPHNSGRLMVSALKAAGVAAVHVKDQHVDILMGRINQVFLGAHCFLANGAVVSRTGARAVALAAGRQKVPVVAFGGHHKLCPVFMEDNRRSPVEPSLPMMAFVRFPTALAHASNVDMSDINVRASVFDLVDSKHVEVLVTDVGAIQPGNLPVLLPDFYCREDFALALQVFEQ